MALNLERFPQALAAQRDLAQTLVAFATTIAIIVAGTWTYRLFIEQRTSEPRPRVTQEVTHHRLTGDTTLLNVIFRVENIGYVKMDLGPALTIVRQISPIDSGFLTELRARRPYHAEDSTKVLWPILAQRVYSFDGVIVEPGETEFWDVDFLVPGSVDVVSVQSGLTLAGVDTARSVWWYAPPVIHSLRAREEP